MGIAFSINYLTDSEDFSQWTAVSTPVLTSGQVDPFGGTQAFLITDDGTGVEGDILTPQFTFDGTKIFSLWFKEAPSPPVSTRISLRDDTTADTRGMLDITWTGGTPTVAASSGGSLVGDLESWGNSWFRQWTAAPSVVAANTNQFRIAVTETGGAATGGVLVFGALVTDGTERVLYETTTGAAKTTVYRGRGCRTVRTIGVTSHRIRTYEIGCMLNEIGI